MFGSHLSIAGSMHLALLEAERLGLDGVQVFTKNQQQWKAPPLKAEAIAAWKAELARLGWSSGPGKPERVTSHASYLINVASPDSSLRTQSMDLLRDEVERCEALDIGLLVFHPGAHTSSTREEGLERIADACAAILKATPGYRTVMCFENVAGAGSSLGRSLEELAWLRERTIDLGGPAARVGFCIDTCHAHAAGYDLSTPALASAFMADLDQIVGLANVRSLHVNDSKGVCGSRLDRHQHIGAGTIGADQGGGFAAVVGHPALALVPKIMETPKGDSPEGVNWDTINVSALRDLVSGKRLPRVVIEAPKPAGVKPKATAGLKADGAAKRKKREAPRASPKAAPGKAAARIKVTGGGAAKPAKRAPAAPPRRAKAKRSR
jgi:deoxyribonuclease-4